MSVPLTTEFIPSDDFLPKITLSGYFITVSRTVCGGFSLVSLAIDAVPKAMSEVIFFAFIFRLCCLETTWLKLRASICMLIVTRYAFFANSYVRKFGTRYANASYVFDKQNRSFLSFLGRSLVEKCLCLF